MQTNVEFRSSKFPSYPNESEEINPNRWGKRLAEYLKEKFQSNGVQSEDIFIEDWGIGFYLTGIYFQIWIGCGNYEEYPDGFLCFIEPSKGFVRKWFRKIDLSDKIKTIVAMLDTILKNDPDIRDIKWWEK